MEETSGFLYIITCVESMGMGQEVKDGWMSEDERERERESER